jgi:hypothetical protein
MSFELVQKLKPYLEQLLEDHGFSNINIKNRIIRGFDATEKKYFTEKGRVVDERQVEDFETQRKYLELALKVKGEFKDENNQRMPTVINLIHHIPEPRPRKAPGEVVDTRGPLPVDAEVVEQKKIEE